MNKYKTKNKRYGIYKMIYIYSKFKQTKWKNVVISWKYNYKKFSKSKRIEIYKILEK